MLGLPRLREAETQPGTLMFSFGGYDATKLNAEEIQERYLHALMDGSLKEEITATRIRHSSAFCAEVETHNTFRRGYIDVGDQDSGKHRRARIGPSVASVHTLAAGLFQRPDHEDATGDGRSGTIGSGEVQITHQDYTSTIVRGRDRALFLSDRFA